MQPFSILASSSANHIPTIFVGAPDGLGILGTSKYAWSLHVCHHHIRIARSVSVSVNGLGSLLAYGPPKKGGTGGLCVETTLCYGGPWHPLRVFELNKCRLDDGPYWCQGFSRPTLGGFNNAVD